MRLSVLGYEVVDRVARIPLVNPPVNALDVRFLEDFEAVLARLCPPAEVRAALIRSDCPGFFSKDGPGDSPRSRRPSPRTSARRTCRRAWRPS